MSLPKVSERVHFVRTTTREGDTSPKMSAVVSGGRTAEAREHRKKKAQNKQKKLQKKNNGQRATVASEGLAKQMASFRETRGTDDGNKMITGNDRQIQAIVLASAKNKKGFPPSHYVGKTKKVVRGQHPQEVIEGKRARAYLRAIKREINKVLKFAFRKARVYGYAFYALILSFLCTELQQWHEKYKEASCLL